MTKVKARRARSKQLTVRDVPPELARRLAALAGDAGKSVNTVVLELLEQAVGSADARRRLLERYATWTEADKAELDEALRAQRRVDDALWR